MDKEMSGSKLRKLRRQAGLSQSEFGDRLGVGQTAVSRWETGRVAIPESRIPEIANALDVDESELRPDDRPDDNEPTTGRVVKTSADVNRWRDELAAAEMDFNVRGLLALLPAFQDDADDWPLVVVTRAELLEDGNVPEHIINEHWDDVLASEWVERVKDVEWVLRLVFPGDN